MREHFELFTKEKRAHYVSIRFDLNNESHTKPEDTAVSFAQSMEVCEDLKELSKLRAKYLIIGIPEDIGVRANMGRAGASDAWESFLESFLSLQQSSLNDVSRFCVLGSVNTKDLMLQAQNLIASSPKDRTQLSDLVKLLDQRVSEIASLIIASGKIPIVIGGGHNNSYPLLRACGYTLPVDCINIDAHTDLRPASGRHSGNGFSHAIQEGYLRSYYMIGIQEHYLSQPMIDLIGQSDAIDYSSYNFENFKIQQEVLKAISHVDTTNFVLEIDMDVVADFPSSAQTPAGYSFQELRIVIKEIIRKARQSPKYIHICEAAPCYGYKHQVGKALASLINDLP
ncbi:formimidoylglutamase [Nonlabens sp.]|uniref:formimidoylglutamase n=1 Tax=Nonlabens sp. TaxID=1888209 RepID=UPI001BCE960D|nr:formimidoylglutamase [Nonlabens sp.]